MKIHRFFYPVNDLKDNFRLTDSPIIHQWVKVLRFKPDQQLVLFNGRGSEKLYNVTDISSNFAQLDVISKVEPKIPKQQIILIFSLLKKDKNDWVLQKATELGVTKFAPLIADRSEKTGFNRDRAKRIVIEAAEQCGRSDIPFIYDPKTVTEAIAKFQPEVKLFICEQGKAGNPVLSDNVGVLIGPEGGWSDAEKQLFEDKQLNLLGLHDFTLRAETAAIAAVLTLQK